MEYLRIKNWEEFQHYKDRNPPWIKLHRALLDNYEFCSLQDSHKAHLVMIWIHASQNNGLVPNDKKFLEQKLSCKGIDLSVFIKSGFLIVEQVASVLLADCKQVATESVCLEEKRREEDIEPEKPKAKKSIKTSLPNDFGISDRVRSWAAEKNHSRLESHLEGFISACRKGGYAYADWDEAFMDAIRKDWAKLGALAIVGSDKRFAGAK